MQLAIASLATCQHVGAGLDSRRGGARSSQQQRMGRPGAAALVVRASSLDSKGLFTSNSSLLGPKPNLGGPSLGPQLGAKSSKPQINIDDVPLRSGVSLLLRAGSQAGHQARC